MLVTMLQTAKDDEESLKASETLWTLAFDAENRKEITNNQAAIGELEKLLSSENSEVKKAAAGALWECQGKDKHKEAKQATVTIQEASGTVVCIYSIVGTKDNILDTGLKEPGDVDQRQLETVIILKCKTLSDWISISCMVFKLSHVSSAAIKFDLVRLHLWKLH